jgi:mono/diheme cytochrome c family protein
MNYPTWEIPAPGLLIAGIAILHVFIAHFAVGGGLFLVLAERKARREDDDALLDYVRRFSRFFILLTLVLGAATGVGIWFTIGLVHPAATSSLINTFVWGWAIEWTFFFTEIAAAMVYYYGWDRMDGRTHMAIGWIYFWAAWLSLVVINGILPGNWVRSREFWDGLLNPTTLPSLIVRTAIAAGLAGLYALFVVAGERDGELKRKVARYASGWILAMAVVGPVSLWWYLKAATAAGVPVGSILGSGGQGVAAAIRNALTLAAESGYPMAQQGFRATIVSSALILIFVLVFILPRARRFGRVAAGALLLFGFLGMAGGEWIREDLRKPFVIGYYMFVNGVRLPDPKEVPRPPEGVAFAEDRYSLNALNRTGVLPVSLWHDVAAPPAPDAEIDDTTLELQQAAGGEMFKLLCSQCHTRNGYNAVLPLVKGKSVGALDGTLRRLARVTNHEGETIDWADWLKPGSRLRTWRNRRMPPFAGTDAERRALAVYLARLGGARPEQLAAAAESAALGDRHFEEYCSPCHAADSDWPMAERIGGRDAAEFYELLGRLEEINEDMPPFEGTEQERRAVAEYLEGLE